MSIKPQTSVRTARDLPRVDHPSIPDTFGLDGRVLIGTSDAEPEDASFVRIGFLSDMPTGSSLAEYLDPIILAFEDAIVEGRLQRQVELIATQRRGTAGRTRRERRRCVPRSVGAGMRTCPVDRCHEQRAGVA
jgi:hypothetical protein